MLSKSGKTMGFNAALAALGMMLSLSCVAETRFRVDLGAGFVHVNGGQYEEGFILDHGIAFENVLVYRFGYIIMDEIHLVDSRFDNDDVEIEVNAPYMGIGKTFDLKPIQIELGGGLMYAKTRGDYLGRKFESDRETSPYVNAKLLIPLSELISLQADAKYIDDVSGGNLQTFNFGVRFNF